MDPSEIEFLAENELVSIIPNFNYGKIFLVSGEIGPFRAGIPLKVPIWLAVNLKTRQKCRLVAPDWLDIEKLEELKTKELESDVFCKMPSEYYIVEAQMLLNVADGDIPRSDALRTIIKDIWDKRLAKLRSSIDKFIRDNGSCAKLNHLTPLEINSVRPILPHAMDLSNRLRNNQPGLFSQHLDTAVQPNSSAQFSNSALQHSSFNFSED